MCWAVMQRASEHRRANHGRSDGRLQPIEPGAGGCNGRMASVDGGQQSTGSERRMAGREG